MAKKRSGAGRASGPSRLFDLALGLPAAVLATPLVVVLAAGSALAFRTSPFFTQPRVGRGGVPFRFVKIRTLPPAVPPDIDKRALASHRTCGFGRFLRRTHLDELPQLWLVVWGRMSLIGPRPEMPVLVERFDPAFAARRSEVRGGCTGLWQIGPGSTGLIAEAPAYDLWYLEHRSLRLDVWILWRTVLAVFGAAPVPLDRVPGFRPENPGPARPSATHDPRAGVTLAQVLGATTNPRRGNVASLGGAAAEQGVPVTPAPAPAAGHG